MYIRSIHRLIVLLVILLAFWVIMSNPIMSPALTPSSPRTFMVPTRYMDIESYVRNYIGEISPVQESLGGHFYVTAIQTKNGSGTVYYEDGHNAYIGDFTYSVDKNGKPEVQTFTVRK